MRIGLPFLAKGDQKDVAEVAAQELKLFSAGKPDAKEVVCTCWKMVGDSWHGTG